MNTRYLALTIGPVVATLQNTRSTKATWAASYLFSWIMRETLRHILQTPGVQLLNLSYRPQDQAAKGVGLFPDRFVARLATGANPDLKTTARNIVAELARKMTTDLNSVSIQRAGPGKIKMAPAPPFDPGELSAFLHDYLRLISLDFELPTTENNPVKHANAYLNSLELQAPFVPVQTRDYLGAFFEDLLYNHFIRDEFGEPGFPSTPEIATATFRALDEMNYDKAVDALRHWDGDNSETARRQQEEFIKTVKNIGKDRFKLCHKYIAIVQSDGDNVGFLFETLSHLDAERPLPCSSSRSTSLAEALADFSLAAAGLIRHFGGIPVYAGGDDLLFFAPVAVGNSDTDREQRRNIFHLLREIDTLFENNVLNAGVLDAETKSFLAAQGKMPSVSHGVSISHHKYPLGESLQKAREDLLFDAIKAGDRRNGIAWRVTKHSGAGFGCVFQKSLPDGVFAAFRQLQETQFPAGEEPEKLLASVIFKLESLEGLFQAVAGKPDYPEHFYHILYNNFNERIHRDERDHQKLSPYLEKVHGLLVAAFRENPPGSISGDGADQVRKNLQTAYAVLRFLHFLNTTDKS